MDGNEAIMNYGNVKIEFNDDGCVIRLSGELDHHSVGGIRNVIDEKLIDYRPPLVVIDLGGVSFTDSAGLGLILGRYARIKDYGGTLELCCVSEEFMKILRLAGTEKLMRITPAQKKKTKV